MGNSDKHLLEIFQDIEKRDRAEASGAGGSLDDPAPRRSVESIEPSELRPPADRRLWSEAVACIAAFALGVLTDRLFLNGGGDAGTGEGGVAHAATTGQQETRESEYSRPLHEPAGNGGPVAAGAGSAGAPAGSSSGAPAPGPSSVGDGGAPTRPGPLFDPANAYVVQVATYNGGQGERARSTYEYLLDEGLPAFPPQHVSGNLVLLVGARPSRAELVGIQDQVHRMPGPTGTQREFSSAYIVRKSLLGID